MRQKTSKGGIVRRLLITLILALCLVTISSSPVFALSLEDYFTLDYDIELSKTAIRGSETLYATVEGTATCNQDLPLTVTEGYVTSRITAEHQVSSTVVTLNSSYTINIDPFPNQAGDSTQATETVSLSFPSGSQSGTYDIEGRLLTARINTTSLGWLPVTAYLPSTEAMGTVTYTSASGGGGGGGGIVVEPDSDFSDYIDSSGAFTEDLTFESEDGMCQLSIDQDTIGLTEDEEPLDELTIVEMEDPPDPPQDATVIGLTYQLGPEGVSFDSPTTLIFTYDPSLIPEGVSEENLLLATWDESAGEWVVLEGCTVDVDNHTISAPVSHFSTFAILGYTRPAALEVSDLTITPGEVNVGETVAIISLITNTGDLAGTYEVTLKINDVAVETKQVEVTGGAQQRVAFTLAKDAAGTYTVNVNGLSGTFEVKQPPAPAPAAFTTSELRISPTEVTSGEKVTISVVVANTGDLAGTYEVTLKINDVAVETKQVEVTGGAQQRVAFTLARDAAGTYTVTVDGLSETFEVEEAASKPSNWRLIAIIAGVTAAIVVPLVIRRRRRVA